MPRLPLPGMRLAQLSAVAAEAAPGFHADRPLTGRRKRPCSRCGRTFLPTMARRLLCKPCFKGRDDGGGMAA